MNTHQTPNIAELPSSQQLRKSTLTGIGIAAVLLVTVVLPSEYNIDPTGMGRVLGLTEMGEIKTQLAAEAEADRKAAQPTAAIAAAQAVSNAVSTPAIAGVAVAGMFDF